MAIINKPLKFTFKVFPIAIGLLAGDKREWFLERFRQRKFEVRFLVDFEWNPNSDRSNKKGLNRLGYSIISVEMCLVDKSFYHVKVFYWSTMILHRNWNAAELFNFEFNR